MEPATRSEQVTELKREFADLADQLNKSTHEGSADAAKLAKAIADADDSEVEVFLESELVEQTMAELEKVQGDQTSQGIEEAQSAPTSQGMVQDHGDQTSQASEDIEDHRVLPEALADSRTAPAVIALASLGSISFAAGVGALRTGNPLRVRGAAAAAIGAAAIVAALRVLHDPEDEGKRHTLRSTSLGAGLVALSIGLASIVATPLTKTTARFLAENNLLQDQLPKLKELGFNQLADEMAGLPAHSVGRIFGDLTIIGDWLQVYGAEGLVGIDNLRVDVESREYPHKVIARAYHALFDELELRDPPTLEKWERLVAADMFAKGINRGASAAERVDEKELESLKLEFDNWIKQGDMAIEEKKWKLTDKTLAIKVGYYETFAKKQAYDYLAPPKPKVSWWGRYPKSNLAFLAFGVGAVVGGSSLELTNDSNAIPEILARISSLLTGKARLDIDLEKS